MKTQQRYLLENCALFLNKPVEYILVGNFNMYNFCGLLSSAPVVRSSLFQEGVYDADVHIDILESAIAEGGRCCAVVCDALLPPLKMGNTLFLLHI